MIKLPKEFEARMQDMLGSAYPAFVRSYEKQKVQDRKSTRLNSSHMA